jgi:hypothetical protein
MPLSWPQPEHSIAGTMAGRMDGSAMDRHLHPTHFPRSGQGSSPWTTRMPKNTSKHQAGFEVNSSFIGEFKSGDNIVYNLAIPQTLYDALKSTPPDHRVLMAKPIVVQIACITEAVLVDLALRILQHTRGGVPSIPPSKLAKVRKKVEKSKEHLGFRRVISIFAESNVFDADPSFYSRLVELSTLRNRVHISNRKRLEPADEGDLFLEGAKLDAEKLCEELVRKCASSFARGPHIKYVKPLRFQWTSHRG